MLKGSRTFPRVIIVRKLPRYVAAKAEFMPRVSHRQDKRSKNHAEKSHRPTRELERRMRGVNMRGNKSAGHAQRFLLSFDVIALFVDQRADFVEMPVIA